MGTIEVIAGSVLIGIGLRIGWSVAGLLGEFFGALRVKYIYHGPKPARRPVPSAPTASPPPKPDR